MAPVPALRSRLHPSPGRLAAALAVLAVLVCAVWVPLDILAGQNVLSNSGQDLVTSVSLAGLGFLIARRLPANPIGWLVLAGAVAFLFGGIVVFPVTALDQSLPGPAGLPVTILNTLSFIALPACMAVAVLKYRLYDIDRILSRTLAYAIVTGLLVGVYAGVVLLSTQVLQFHSAVSVAVATLAAVALFSPLRRRVQNAVDRRFNRARYDADQAVAAFAARLKDAVDLDAVRADLLATAARTLEPAHASVWLRPAGQASTDGTSVSPGGTPVLHLKPRPMPLHMGYKVRK